MLDRPVFNAWHADVANSSACDLIFRQALGLPAEVVSNSLLTWAGIAEVTAALRLAPGQTLVDLACGRGGYSREVARRTGARLIGLDFSAVAVTIAARSTGQRERAGFFVGDFTAIGLRDHSAGAVMCVDAIQFSDPPLAALGECRRILARGGRPHSWPTPPVTRHWSHSRKNARKPSRYSPSGAACSPPPPRLDRQLDQGARADLVELLRPARQLRHAGGGAPATRAEQAISVVERADAEFFHVAPASIVPALQLLASLDTNPHP